MCVFRTMTLLSQLNLIPVKPSLKFKKRKLSLGATSYELAYKLLSHPQYPLSLTPNELFLFLNFWKGLTRVRFNCGIIVRNDAYFNNLGKSYYLKKNKSIGEPCDV